MSSLRGRLIHLVFFAAVLLPSIAPAQSREKPRPDAPLKIGLLLDSLKVERWQTDLDAFKKRAQELGAEVLVEAAEGDDDLQFAQAHRLLRAGVSSLVLVPHNTDEAVRIVASAKATGVAVLDYERLIRNSDIDCFVGSNAEAIGELQAASLIQLAPKGNYILLEGSSTDVTASMLRDGQMKILKPLVDRGDIKILAQVWATDWMPIQAYAHLEEAIESSKGDIAAVVAANDGLAGGAIQALEEHKLAGKVLVSGQDADLAAIIRILEGTQAMTVYKPVRSEASQAAEAAVSLARGEAIKTPSTIANGYKNVPAIFVTPVAVTRGNVKETVVRDGFQNLETIQKSLPKEDWPN
jgi:D-xylose transport system substrate-binding protein